MNRKQFDIEETRRTVYDRDDWHCQWPGCFKYPTEMAHGISKGVYGQRAIRNRIKSLYGVEISMKDAERIVNLPPNLRASCKEHNDNFNIHISQTEKFDKRLEELWEYWCSLQSA